MRSTRARPCLMHEGRETRKWLSKAAMVTEPVRGKKSRCLSMVQSGKHWTPGRLGIGLSPGAVASFSLAVNALFASRRDAQAEFDLTSKH